MDIPTPKFLDVSDALVCAPIRPGGGPTGGGAAPGAHHGGALPRLPAASPAAPSDRAAASSSLPQPSSAFSSSSLLSPSSSASSAPALLVDTHARDTNPLSGDPAAPSGTGVSRSALSPSPGLAGAGTPGSSKLRGSDVVVQARAHVLTLSPVRTGVPLAQEPPGATRGVGATLCRTCALEASLLNGAGSCEACVGAGGAPAPGLAPAACSPQGPALHQGGTGSAGVAHRARSLRSLFRSSQPHRRALPSLPLPALQSPPSTSHGGVAPAAPVAGLAGGLGGSTGRVGVQSAAPSPGDIWSPLSPGEGGSVSPPLGSRPEEAGSPTKRHLELHPLPSVSVVSMSGSDPNAGRELEQPSLFKSFPRPWFAKRSVTL